MQFSNNPTEQTHPSQPPALSGHPLCTDKSKYVDFDSESDEEYGQEEEEMMTKIKTTQMHGVLTLCRAWLSVFSNPMNQVLLNTHFIDMEAEAQRGHRTSRWQSQDLHPGQALVNRSSWAGTPSPGWGSEGPLGAFAK